MLNSSGRCVRLSYVRQISMIIYITELLAYVYDLFFFFFFQAEDGIRDWSVTGVQTCALPIWGSHIIFESTLLFTRGVKFA